jgi:hypothetical protein
VVASNSVNDVNEEAFQQGPEDAVGFRFPNKRTTINGMLSLKYERVCGRKGYSYDALMTNERWKLQKEGHIGRNDVATSDLYRRMNRTYSRARVPQELMPEIGYDDCDYISEELVAKRWLDKKLPPIPIEMHVPCRDPVDHLLSMINHRGKKFSCLDSETTNSSTDNQIRSGKLNLERFSSDLLLKLPNSTMKCFNPIPVEPYIDYLSKYLQKKRFTAKYIQHETNRPRDKASECLTKNATLLNIVKERMLETYSYFNFCASCMGSPEELPLR